MNRLLLLLALLMPLGAKAQPLLRNSITTNDLSTNLVWKPSGFDLWVSGDNPGFVMYNTAGSANKRLYFIQSTGDKMYFIWGSDDTLNTGLLGNFDTNGDLSISGYLSLSNATNRLTMANAVLLLDGQPISSSASSPILNLYVSNLYTTNITATTINNTTNLFQVAKGGHLTVTNNLVPQEIGASKLVATASNGALTNADGVFTTRGSVLYKGASGWAALTPNTAGYVLTDGGAGADPSWAAASGGGGAGVNTHVTALTWSGTNAQSFNCVTNGETFYILCTNNVHFGTSTFSNLPAKTAYQTYALCLQMDSVGGWIVSFTNSICAWALGTPPFIETNANAISMVYFHSHPATNSMLIGVANVDVR